MSKKKAYLISCSDHYSHRLHVPDGVLRSRGYDTIYITSDFDHASKEKFVCKVEGCVQLPARSYRKNLSLDRILSHREFARDVFCYMESLPEQPDMLVVQIPPNFLAYYAVKYKRRHPNVKLIFEIFDLWPETFPGGIIKKCLTPIFAVWGAIRDRSLGAADFVVTECEMFRQRLGLDEKTSKSIWLCAKPLELVQLRPQLRDDVLELCYLGSINNVISIPDICHLLQELSKEKHVLLHIIGTGEHQHEFVNEAKAAGAEVSFYGPIYDEQKKLKIMNRCHFGLNIMKSSVCVGLTMKSVDYFRFGLPIINSIPADTKKLIDEQHIGVQLEAGCVKKILSLTNEDCLQMRRNVNEMFVQSFTKTVIEQQYADVLNHILEE